MEETKSLPQLDAEEIRVLGSLLEKSKTTPEYYPMTINALVNACNQKSSRKPVVSYDESTVSKTLDSLKKKGLISTVVGGGSRVMKYKHNLGIQFPLVPAELAVICLLFLRGPLTAGEINTNSARIHEFEALEDVQEILIKLASDEPSYVKLLPKRIGQKEARYIHLFSEFDIDEYESTLESSASNPSNVQQLESRVSVLEEQLTLLRAEFDKLIAELT